jgi:lipoprotein NlpD
VIASEGERVKRGQQLAEVGQAADGQPMLHFEIRRDGATVDPLLFLPAIR